MKFIRNQSTVIVVMDDGLVLQSNQCDDEMFAALTSSDADGVIAIMCPERESQIKEAQKVQKVLSRVSKSNILNYKNDSVYWEEVSTLSMPMEFVDKVLIAEEENDTEALEAYHNFWVLLSLNPDALCRENLFKFLNKWGMVISKTGLFVGYRNVDIKENDAYTPIYTDVHSHSFSIKVGEMVTMPRKECDSNSHVSCSRGLHIGGTSWLNQCYFGNVGLVCLVNPADVVAVPFDNEEYGKLRCCAYLPIAIAKYNEEGKIIPYTLKDGFEAPYVRTILYDGIKSTEDCPKYTIELKDVENMSIESVSEKVLEIARKYMK